MNDFGLTVGRHFTTLPTLADTQVSELQLDSLGRLIVSGRYLEDTAHVSGDAGLFTMGVRDDGVFATGTYTVVDYTLLAGDSVTVNGTTLTEGIDWTAAVSNNATATSLATAIDGLASVTATATGAVVTVVAASRGAAGNAITTTTSDATNLPVSGATLSGGADNTIWTSDHGDYSPIAVDKYGRINVTASVVVDPSDAEFAEDSANASGHVGIHVLTVRQDTLATSTSANGDYADFKVNALGEHYVTDTAANASLDAIEASTTSIDTKLTTTNSTLATIDTSLNAIEASTTSIDTKLTTTNSTLATIDTSLNNIETDIANLTQVEDTLHNTGDVGVMPLAVRNDSNVLLAGTDLDYIPLSTDATGALRTTATLSPVGAEQFTVTDALAPAGDGLATITASATPWVTVASFAHTSGTAYVFGFQWACDQNADARLITDDTTDIIVYKRSINSSAAPTWAEHWSNEGRIEIPGAASLEIKLQIKKRSATGGNALGTGSIHIRK